MKPGADAIYVGQVAHRRVRPVSHALRYHVFAILIDCGRLDDHAQRMRLFSHNRFNLFSLYDRDHGDGANLNDYLNGVAAEAGCEAEVERFVMLCYPRILGYAFNPLTVYFGLDRDGSIRLTVYEVNNTFGERMTYVLPARQNGNGLIHQQCDKAFYVSPFNPVSGRYSFHLTPLGEQLTVGVALSDDDGPVMLAHFRAEREALNDSNLLRAIWRTGMMTIKVIAGIHLEAARLWLKGLRPVTRPAPPQPPLAIYPRDNALRTSQK